MSRKEKEDYAKYRMERAYEAIKAAILLVDKEMWNSAANRLYYSCYYAVNAALVLKGITAHTHSGVKTQFSLHFVKTGTLPKEFGKLYSLLSNTRQAGDYEDFVRYTKEEILPLINKTKQFIDTIHQLIKEDKI